MKKIFLLTMLAGTLLFSCSKEKDSVLNPDKESVALVAKFADETATKTSMDETGKVLWNAGDAINVFNINDASAKFVSSNASPAQVVEFTGNLPIEKGTTVYGLYPYSEKASCNSGEITTTLTDEQNAVEGKMADGLLITVGAASSDDMNMTFYNVCSGIRFKLAQPGVKAVILESVKGEHIAGKFTVNSPAAGEKPSIKTVLEGKTSITVAPEDGSTFKTDTWYYIVTLPIEISSSGIKFAIYNGHTISTRTRSAELTLERGKFRQVSKLDNMVLFKNQTVKEISLRWDTDGDDELSFEEAAAVVKDQIGGAFRNQDITYFDEFQYFTGVTEIPNNCFQECEKLTSIILPSSITSMGYECFSHCTALRNITIPSGVTTIGVAAFVGCDITVRMEGTTPPTIDTGTAPTFPAGTTIEVPSAALANYQSAWGSTGLNIVGY